MAFNPRDDVPIRRTVRVEVTVGWLIIIMAMLAGVFAAGLGFLVWLAFQWLGA